MKPGASKVVSRIDSKPTVFHGMVTVAPQMLAFFAQMKKAASTDASVLMRGDTGTGKELAARAIHALGRRAKEPFYAVNCATFTSELMASELFGHVRGAFTGATSDRKGLFELSNGGTLFLDEIAEIPVEVQARLLRVLQERAFTPVGGTVIRKANVRLVSATHASLRNAVEDGRFREDLMYRVRVIPLFLPRLAEREGDVEMLAWRFLDEFAKAGYRTVKSIETRARDALLGYSWPGNVRELRNIIEYAATMGDGDVLRFQDLTPELRGESPPQAKPRTLADLERQKIVEALARVDGSRLEAASALKMSRSTLWRKLREYGIVPQTFNRKALT